jgi:hypothetical protein
VTGHPWGTLAEFWSWGFGDLRSNGVRGVFAEYLVGRALGVDLTAPRQEWGNYDLLTPDGTKVEVKTGAYVQAWTPPQTPSGITYRGLMAREWVAGTAGTYSEDSRVRADVFVFALQMCRDPARYDALDLDQWEFRVASGAAVRRWNQQSIALTRLVALGLPVTGWTGLRRLVGDVTGEGA